MAGLLGRLFRRQRTPELRCSAVVPAAGSSTRMEGQDKLSAKVLCFCHSLSASFLLLQRKYSRKAREKLLPTPSRNGEQTKHKH